MRHGGDLDAATRLHGQPQQGWLDLSTGINPRPYAAAGLDRSLDALPSVTGLSDLLAAARSCYGAGNDLAIAATPGSEIVIRALPALLSGAVALVRTSYSSYHEAFAATDRLTSEAGLEPLAQSPDRSVIVVNPNNPDGKVISPHRLLDVARSRSDDAAVVIDEAFADTEAGVSIVPHLKAADRVLVLRSFGKFFGLPGLRLAFVLGHPELVGQIARRLGDWPVSGPAQVIGAAALADGDWQRETRHWLGNQAQALDAVLARAGLKLRDGTRLFRAVEASNAPGLHEALARQGVWTRIFADWPGLMRFGLPPDRDGLRRLAAALSA